MTFIKVPEYESRVNQTQPWWYAGTRSGASFKRTNIAYLYALTLFLPDFVSLDGYVCAIQCECCIECNVHDSNVGLSANEPNFRGTDWGSQSAARNRLP